MDSTPVTSTERLDRIAERIKVEILAAIEDGTFPPTADSFHDLHDHCDANYLGGLCDENADVETPDLVYIQEIVHAWLQAGRPGDQTVSA